MGTTQTADTPNYETVWAILQENALQMKELRESQKESKEDFNTRLGALTNLFGDFS